MVKFRTYFGSYRGIAVSLLAIGGLATTGRAGEESKQTEADLTGLSLEALMDVEVTSVSKQKQRIADAPAAVTVISQDEIRQSGMTSIAELLRTVPGLSVSRLNSQVWEIGARGMADQFSNKLLVLMDGRTLYNRAFSGVYWDQQDYLLQDLERIEVIRGPGATLWGSNAVNGVINITSKSARDTQGLLLTGTVSNEEAIGGLRYGGKIDDDTYYRGYLKYRNVDDFPTASGNEAEDGWEATHGGFRIDRYASANDVLTLQGDISRQYGGEYQDVPSLTPPYSFRDNRSYVSGGANVLARWTHTISSDSSYSFQTYFDRVYRHGSIGNYEQNLVDIDFQHRFRLDPRNEVIYGFGARYIGAVSEATSYVSLEHERQEDYEVSAFVQDNITIVPDRFHLVLGSKFEHTDYSEPNIQPSGRLLWTPDERNSVWLGVSRAVRTSSIFERTGHAWIASTPTPQNIPARISISSDPNANSEELMAYELGYRVQPTPLFSIDFASFINVYDKLRSYDAGAPKFVNGADPFLVFPYTPNTNYFGETYGFEVSARWNATERLHLGASYSLAIVHMHSSSDNILGSETELEKNTPRNQAQVHVRYDLTHSLELNGAAYYVEQTGSADRVPSYIRVDTSLTYRPTENSEFSVGIQNIFDDRHPEATSTATSAASEMPRTVFAQFTLRY